MQGFDLYRCLICVWISFKPAVLRVLVCLSLSLLFLLVDDDCPNVAYNCALGFE